MHSTPSRGRPALVTALTLVLSPLAMVSLADDWPQWRGPERTGAAPAFEPPAQWPQTLRLGWQHEVGRGDSSPVVADGVVYTFTRIGEQETVTALDLSSGEVLWRRSYEQPFEPLVIVQQHGAGPFSTPSVRDRRVFTLGIREVLTAWDAKTGEQLWQHEFSSDFKRTQTFYGTSQSPLVLADRVLVHLGGPGEGALAAFDPETGERLWWQPTADGPAYGSMLAIEVEGEPQIATFTQRRLIGFDPNDGAVLWETPFKVTWDATNLTPLRYRDLLIVSGSRVPTRAYRIVRDGDGWALNEAWSTDEVTMEYSSPVLAGERLFAFSQRNKGEVVCLDPATGELLWSGPPRQGDNAYLIAAPGVVVVVREDAEAEVIDATASEYRALAHYEVGGSFLWAHPALFDHYLLIKDLDHVRLWEIVPDAPPADAAEGAAR